MDVEEVKARALVEQLRESLPGTTLFWDRGPYCARIPLVDPDPANEGSPALFAFVEDSDDYRIKVNTLPREQWGWVWHVAMGGEFTSEWATDLQDSISFRLLERTWLGDGPYEVACQVTLLVDILKHGIEKVALIHDVGEPGNAGPPCGTPVQNAHTTGDPDLVTCRDCIDRREDDAVGPTYHGIVKAHCSACGFTATRTVDLEYWNDIGAACIACPTKDNTITWTMQDGEVRTTTWVDGEFVEPGKDAT